MVNVVLTPLCRLTGLLAGLTICTAAGTEVIFKTKVAAIGPPPFPESGVGVTGDPPTTRLKSALLWLCTSTLKK